MFKVPEWMVRRHPKPSVLLLADMQVKYWPEKDKVCEVIYHKNWPLKRWNQALRMGLISVTSHTVVLYLESTRCWQDVPPIKNTLTMLCKTLRNIGNNPRIFISNHLPRIGVNPVPISSTSLQFYSATSHKEHK